MQSFELKLEDGKWLNPPANFNINEASIVLQTEPSTDFWQRSYYGFQNDNAPAYLFESDKNFTFTVKADFTYKKLFDQCGIVIYLNSENWFKASIEYENDESVSLTQLGGQQHQKWELQTHLCQQSNQLHLAFTLVALSTLALALSFLK